MPGESFTIQGRTISSETQEESSTINVTIDGLKIQVEHDADRGKYSTPQMPYRDYDSLKELVESLVANHPDFKDPRPPA